MFFRQDAFAAQVFQRPLEFVGQRLEHTSDHNSGRRGNKHDRGQSEGCQAMETAIIGQNTVKTTTAEDRRFPSVNLMTAIEDCAMFTASGDYERRVPLAPRVLPSGFGGE